MSVMTDIAGLVTSWNPDAVLVGGNTYGYGANGDFATANSAYSAFVTAGKLFPSIGDQDYASPSATDLTNYLSYFQPPGWNTPTNLSGNNGRYYSVKIGPYVEAFCLNPGWNSDLINAALQQEGVVTTLEPGGITPGSPQYEWAKTAIQASTARWKLVFFHCPPFTSVRYIMPGFFALRWPFQDWGVTAVLCGHAITYERLEIDGMTYFVGGWSGGGDLDLFSTPYSIGSKARENTQYGALKLTATNDWLRVEALTTANNVQLSRVDDVVFWADPVGKGFKRYEFTQSDAVQNTTVGPTTPMLQFHDTEYVDLGGTALARMPRQEAEVYVLVSEDSRYRSFAALPFLPSGCRTIVYDKWLGQVRWYPNTPQDIMVPAVPSDTMIGLRSSQTIEFLAMPPQGTDAEFWRQKAAQIQSSPCHERTVKCYSFPVQLGVPYTYDTAAYSPTIVGDNPVIFTKPGAIRVENLPVFALARQSRAQWFQLNFLVEPARNWYHAASAWSASDSRGAVSVDGAGMVLPPANAGNLFQLVSNSPVGAWNMTLPAGAYDVSFEWMDLNANPIPTSFTVRWNSQVIQNEVWTGMAGVLQFSPACRLVSNSSAEGTLTLTLNGPVQPVGVRIARIKIERKGTPEPEDYRYNLVFYDTNEGTGFASMPSQTCRFRGIIGRGEVLSTSWIDVASVDARTILNCELRLLDQPGVAISVKSIELRTRIKVDAMPEWRSYASYRDTCLTRTIEGIRARYSTRVPDELRPNSGTGWDATVTSQWLTALVEDEPRLSLAFRPAVPGDVGRPALVPAGVYFDGTSVISAGTMADCAPTLTPWQPWMASLNFPVAMEDFWVVPEPTKPVKLVLIDPTGQDQISFDSNSPSLDFSQSSNSQYLPLAL